MQMFQMRQIADREDRGGRREGAPHPGEEKLYVELKHILARQPGPEVPEQLQIYQATLKEMTKQMKVG